MKNTIFLVPETEYKKEIEEAIEKSNLISDLVSKSQKKIPAALYFSTKIAIGIIALQMFFILWSRVDLVDVDDSLNGMIEQLRLRISDLEEKLEDKRIPPII